MSMTMLELVRRLAQSGLDADAIETAASRLIDAGTVRLTGIYAGRRISTCTETAR